MKKLEFMNSIKESFNKTGFQIKKHSPEILMVVGIFGTIASTVVACKVTTKIDKILDKTKGDLFVIRDCAANEAMAEEYSEDDAKRDLAIVYIQTGVKLARLYAPAIALGAVSLGCILASNNIIRKRNVALAAAYATVDKGFKEYRSRVIERFGKEIDRELKHNLKAKKIEKIVVGEDGKEKKVKEEIQIAEYPDGYSDYARFFDEGCTGWGEDSEYSLMFLRAQQQYANDKLKANGRLFLNEVYDMLGIPKTKAGQVVGWVYNPEKPTGDNYVDFGIYDAYKEVVRNFVNGYESVILLDFNVDGNIWDLM